MDTGAGVVTQPARGARRAGVQRGPGAARVQQPRAGGGRLQSAVAATLPHDAVEGPQPDPALKGRQEQRPGRGTWCFPGRMNRLCDVEPRVMDDEMLKLAVGEQGPRDEAGQLAKQEGILFKDVLSLQLDFQSAYPGWGGAGAGLPDSMRGPRPAVASGLPGRKVRCQHGRR